jgi:hypothetical protein
VVTSPPASSTPPAVELQAGGTLASGDIFAAPADRIGNAEQVTATLPPPPEPPGFANARCPQWWPQMLEAGWPAEDLWHVDRIVWGESRCDEHAYNGSGGDRSYGLMQINVKASSGNQSLVGPWVDWDWSRLHDAATNLRVGLMMADYVEDELSWCRWRPWTTRDRGVCG